MRAALAWQPDYSGDAIHDPAIMDTQAPGLRLNCSNTGGSFITLTHELEHVFGAGLGEYYSVRRIQDRTGVPPYQDLDASDPADPYRSKHTGLFNRSLSRLAAFAVVTPNS